MPKKIKVVDVVSSENSNTEVTPSENIDAVNDIQQTNINNNDNNDIIINDNNSNEQIVNEVVLKPKTRAKPRAKKKIETILEEELIQEPIQEPIKEPVNEDIKEEITNNKLQKIVQLVKCNKCNKMINQKTLRYTHEANCKGDKIDIPVKRRPKKVEDTQQINRIDDIPQDIKEEVIRTIEKTKMRLKRREENLNNLKSQMF